MRKIFPYIACLFVLAACGKVGPVVVPDDDEGRTAISFGTTMEAATKGDASLSDLESGGWGLYGYYTGTSDYVNPATVSGTLFNHRQVRWDSSNSIWDYSIDAQHKKEYWPMDPDDKVSFFAYGPYSLYSSNAYVNNETGPYVSYTASTDLTQQKDLLWATNTSGLPHRNVNQASYASGEVDMHFRHAPAKIHFNINSPSQVDQSTPRELYNTSSTVSYEDYDLTNEQNGTLRYNNNNYTAYNAYRTKRTETTNVYHQTINGLMILVDRVQMENFHGQGDLLLNNPDPFVPAWTPGNQTISYSFDGDELNPVIVNPGNDAAILDGWRTTYLGVDSDTKELLQTPNNYIYMVPKTADTEDEENTKNIRISVYYHLLGYTGSDGLVVITETTTTTQRQTVRYITTGNGNNKTTRYLVTDNTNAYTNDTFQTDRENANVSWTNTGNASTSDPVVSMTQSPDMHSQDNGGAGYKAIGRIRTSILGGRDYTINLYLNGSDLDLTVIPQPWDLQEIIYDINAPLNAIRQPLTYDGNFIYQWDRDKVYINNRMGKFYFRLDRGKYLYWQASLIGDDAFAFTDENGNYLLDDKGNFMTSIRGDISGEMNYIYVKATNTSSKVTSQAKLRIYLFDADNHAVVALPQEGWLFINATYEENGQTKRVQEWTVVQSAN